MHIFQLWIILPGDRGKYFEYRLIYLKLDHRHYQVFRYTHTWAQNVPADTYVSTCTHTPCILMLWYLYVTRFPIQHPLKTPSPISPAHPLLIHIYKRLCLVYFINSHILLFLCHMDMILGPIEHSQNIIFGLHSQYSYKLDYVCIIFVLNFLCNICTQCIYKKVRNNECRKQVQTK